MEHAHATIEHMLESGYCHAFIVTPNVHDIVFSNDGAPPKGFRDRLCRDLSAANRIIYCYTLSRGYAVYINGKPYDENDKQHHKIGKTVGDLVGLPPLRWGQDSIDTGHDVNAVIGRFEKLLYTHCDYDTLGVKGTGLVIENAEYLAPRTSMEPGYEQRVINEALLRWGYDRLIRGAGNVVVLLAAERGGLAQDLVSARSGYQIVTAPFPEADARQEFLNQIAPGAVDRNREVAAVTNGLRLADLEQLVRLRGDAVSEDDVKEKKRQVLEGLCHGVVELIEPRFSLGDANAQPQIAHYLGEVSELMRREQAKSPEQRCPFIPKALLFVGPPGNGKSHLAAAFAKQSGMAVVRFKNLRSMYVGESERNLETALEVLPSLRPVVLFVDEIDQMMSARSMSGQATSHEVEQHLLARLLAFMGDDRYRGEILWIGATNRPDLLDAAMLRRFDRVLPFMNPSREQIRGLVADLAKVLNLNLMTEQSGWDEIYQLMEERDLSCDAIQKAIRHASELSVLASEPDWRTIKPEAVKMAVLDYIPNHDPDRYRFMCLHSLAAVSFVTDIPWAEKAQVPTEFQDYLKYDSQDSVTVVGIDRVKIEDALTTLARSRH